jgi:hypothetical protein
MMGAVLMAFKVRRDVRGVPHRSWAKGSLVAQTSRARQRRFGFMTTTALGEIDQLQRCRGMALPRRVRGRSVHEIFSDWRYWVEQERVVPRR